MTRVTVIQPIARLGGIDVLFDGLARQTFKDYELVLVDAWADLRRDAVREEADRRGIPLAHHVQPAKRGLAHALNVGVRHARGELVCPLNDHHWTPSTWLERHWGAFEGSRGRFTANGFAYHRRPPPLKPAGQPPEAYALSLFQEPFDGERVSDYPILYEETLAFTTAPRIPVRSQLHGLYTSWGREFYNTLNNSIPVEVLLRLNGYDETYDQARAYLDVDMGLRAEAIGHRFLIDTENIVHVLAHEDLDHALGDLWKPYFTFPSTREENMAHLTRCLEAVETLLRAPGLDLRELRRGTIGR